jgi:hypothetical protein
MTISTADLLWWRLFLLHDCLVFTPAMAGCTAFIEGGNSTTETLPIL